MFKVVLDLKFKLYFCTTIKVLKPIVKTIITTNQKKIFTLEVSLIKPPVNRKLVLLTKSLGG